MSERIFYELSDERDLVSRVVDAIPSDWCWIDGGLGAPEELKNRSRVSDNSVLVISRFYSIKPTIKATERRDENSGFYLPVDRAGLKIKEIILDKKLPSIVRFDEAAFETPREITINDVKELAKGFIQIGYTGHVVAYRDYHDNSKYENSASFEINQMGRKEDRFYKTPNLPPYVELRWDREYGGRREHLDTIVESCERLGLVRIQFQEA